jgi:hypothetical protein
MFFFTHDQFDALVRASLNSRGAVMVLLMQWGHRGGAAAVVLADAIISRQYRYVGGGVALDASAHRRQDEDYF